MGTHPGLIGIRPEAIIDKSSPIPLHYQLERFLREGIINGRFPAGQTLPTEQEFQNYFDLSRTPIRQAIQQLVIAGLVERRRSLGTVVLPRRFEEALTSLRSFTEEVLHNGQKPSSHLIEFTVRSATEEEMHDLMLVPGASVYHIRRLRFINGQPVGLTQSRIPVSIVPDLRPDAFTEDGLCQSMYYVLESIYQIRLVRALEVFSAVNVSDEAMRLLRLPALTAVIQRKRLSFDPAGRAVALEVGLYHAWYQIEWNGREIKAFR
jgi:GntR family transcriptional regulator